VVQDLWGLAPVSVSGRDLTGLAVELQEGMTVTGRVAFEAQTLTPPDLTRVSINLRVPPTSSGISIGVPSVMATTDGTFSVEGVTPGRYTVSANAPSPPGIAPGSAWMLKSATLKGQDVLDSLVEVRPGENISDLVLTFTDQTTEISGMLIDGRGRPAPEYFVFVFPTSRSAWYQGSRRLRQPTRPASDGKYRITGLPPGEYYVAALTDFDFNDISDASFLEQLVGAAFKITLGEGEKKTQDLKLAGGTK
jgi:hypothetical protein